MIPQTLKLSEEVDAVPLLVVVPPEDGEAGEAGAVRGEGSGHDPEHVRPPEAARARPVHGGRAAALPPGQR